MTDRVEFIDDDGTVYTMPESPVDRVIRIKPSTGEWEISTGVAPSSFLDNIALK